MRTATKTVKEMVVGRRRHGVPVHGWLVIDKPAGVTSAAVVTAVRGRDVPVAVHAREHETFLRIEIESR